MAKSYLVTLSKKQVINVVTILILITFTKTTFKNNSLGDLGICKE